MAVKNIIDVEIAVELWIGKLRTMLSEGVLMIPPPIPKKFASQNLIDSVKPN